MIFTFSKPVICNNHLISLRAKHSEEYCAMYDICGQRSDGKALNCPYGSPSVKVIRSSVIYFLMMPMPHHLHHSLI